MCQPVKHSTPENDEAMWYQKHHMRVMLMCFFFMSTPVGVYATVVRHEEMENAVYKSELGPLDFAVI